MLSECEPKDTTIGLGLSLVLGEQTLRAQQSDVDDKRLAELHAKAETGDAKAQNALGNRYYNGQGVTKDMAEAVKWYPQSASRMMPRLNGIWPTATKKAKAWRRMMQRR